MSAGDVDDRLGPEGELERLRAKYPPLDEYLRFMDAMDIFRNFSIPYLAGISNDGQVRYIDHRLNTILSGIDISLALATHESVEWAIRRWTGIGEDYAYDPRGHRLANRAEYNVVGKLFHNLPIADAWDQYDDFIDAQISAIEHGPITTVPADLALYPYEGTPLLDRLKEKMI